MKKLFPLLVLLSAITAACSPKEDPEIAVTGVSLSQTSLALGIGESSNLSASVTPSNATSKAVSWSTSNASVATVNNGTVTAVGEGTVTITATAGGRSGSCQVTVKRKAVEVTSITLDQSGITLAEEESATLKAAVSPDDADDKTVIWESSDQTVATVDAGKVTALKEGSATITAKAGGKTATCKVTVQKNRESEIKEILMELYNALDGPNWKKKSGWSMANSLNSWEGVGYGDDGSLVLSFNQTGLKGEIPSCIGNLSGLTRINIQDEPELTGAIPESFSKLVNLQRIDIISTGLTSLPDVFSRMENLSFVQIIDNNQMTGQLPESLGTLNALNGVYLQQNSLTGGIPASFARFEPNLSLVGNRLTGKVPQSFVESDYFENFARWSLWQQEGYGLDISDLEIPGYDQWIDGQIEDINGKVFSFDEVIHRNKYTVYYIWGSWCPFSNALTPRIRDYYVKYRNEGLEVIATSQVGGVDENGVGHMIDDFEGFKQDVEKRGIDSWYNFYYPDYTVASYLASTPNAEVYDQNGNILFSSFSVFNDPVRNRFGKTASTDLIPFLESLLGPAEDPDTYASTDYSMNGAVMTLQEATVGKGINIVFMGDAYTDRDMGSGGLYETVMKEALEEFFAIEPYKTFRNRFNVYAVKVVSENGSIGSGYTTALGTYFGNGTSIGGDNDKCYEYALKVPGITSKENLLLCVMVNSRRHSGTAVLSESLQSGIAFTSTMGNDREFFGPTLRHEAGGHGFAFLADEYAEQNQQAPREHINHYSDVFNKYGWFSNVDFTDDPSKIKWSSFLSDERYKNEVGIFAGGALYEKGAWRPSVNSMMRENAEYFNAPSRWAIYKRIMELSGEEASFEKFLEYDAVNRGEKQSSAPATRSAITSAKFEHTPPVILP
ncbi:MAG: Ig-like domain-containing protein [Bacteroidales bacterium]|nr:Ig-like domain-containing protein [Bacteroidales bacterium]